jgi:predicted glutamine amidotransferase
MCRLLAYYGEDALLAHTIIHPERSIIKQSYDARERLQDHSLPAHLGFGNLNADGFGIGWYSAEYPVRCSPGYGPPADLEHYPCTFKSITPGLLKLTGPYPCVTPFMYQLCVSCGVSGGCTRLHSSSLSQFDAYAAWNNENLMSLSNKCYSPLVFAHVR